MACKSIFPLWTVYNASRVILFEAMIWLGCCLLIQATHKAESKVRMWRTKDLALYHAIFLDSFVGSFSLLGGIGTMDGVGVKQTEGLPFGPLLP